MLKLLEQHQVFEILLLWKSIRARIDKLRQLIGRFQRVFTLKPGDTVQNLESPGLRRGVDSPDTGIKILEHCKLRGVALKVTIS